MNEQERYIQLAEEGNDQAQTYVGWLLFKDGASQFKEAKIWLNRALDAGNGEAAFYLGKIYERENDINSAIEMYQRSIELHFSPAYYRLGSIYQISGDVPTANTYYRKGMESDHLFCTRQYAVNLIFSGKFFDFFAGLKLLIQTIVKACRVYCRSDAEHDPRVRY